MGTYVLCHVKRAEKPFYLSEIRTNIFSIEELCYFLVNNLYLVDGEVFNEELCDWLEQELTLSRLSRTLRSRIGKFAELQELVYPVIKEINYLTYEEMKKLNAAVQAYNAESPSVRMRKKGDMLFKHGILVSAIHVYQDVIARIEKAKPGKDLPESDFSLIPVLYHNLGCAFARLFQMEKAADCFYEVYRWTGSGEDLKTYMLAYRSIKTPLEYQNRLAELGTEKEVKDAIRDSLEEFRRKPEPQVYARDFDEILEKMIAEYHRSTGF